MTRSSASSAIPISRRRASRRSKASPSDTAKAVRGSGDNFTHYLRERRLQRCWAELGNAARGAPIGLRYRLRLRLQRRRAFQPLVPRPLRVSPRAFRQQAGRTRYRASASRPASAAGRRTRSRNCVRIAPAPMIAAAELEPTNLAPAPRRKAARIIICRSMPTMCIGAISAAR